MYDTHAPDILQDFFFFVDKLHLKKGKYKSRFPLPPSFFFSKNSNINYTYNIILFSGVHTLSGFVHTYISVRNIQSTRKQDHVTSYFFGGIQKHGEGAKKIFFFYFQMVIYLQNNKHMSWTHLHNKRISLLKICVVLHTCFWGSLMRYFELKMPRVKQKHINIFKTLIAVDI